MHRSPASPHRLCSVLFRSCRRPLRKHHRHGYSAIMEHEHENGSLPTSPTVNGNGNGNGDNRKNQPNGGYRSLSPGSTEYLDMLVHHDEELVGVG